MLICGDAITSPTTAIIECGCTRRERLYTIQWIGADGYTYGNLMRRCIAPEEHRNLCTYGEYGWDGWLGMYFVNLPKENITLLIGMQKKDDGTFTLTRKLRNVCCSYLL